MMSLPIDGDIKRTEEGQLLVEDLEDTGRGKFGRASHRPASSAPVPGLDDDDSGPGEDDDDDEALEMGTGIHRDRCVLLLHVSVRLLTLLQRTSCTI